MSFHRSIGRGRQEEELNESQLEFSRISWTKAVREAVDTLSADVREKDLRSKEENWPYLHYRETKYCV